MTAALASFTFLICAQISAADGGVSAEPVDAGPTEAVAADAPLIADAGAAADAGTPDPTAPPLVQAAQGEAQAPSQGFVKGELSVYLGSGNLVVKNNRIGVSAGLDYFHNTLYVALEPLVDLRFFDSKLGVGIGVPLRLELFAVAPDDPKDIGFAHAGRFRKEDYARFHDFGKILKYVTFGSKEDNLYVNVGQRYAATLGHGALMRRYAPNIDVDYQRVSAEVDAYNRFGGFELMTNDILEWNMLAGLAFLKPLAFLNEQNVVTRSLSIGVTAGTDITAPQSLVKNQFGTRQLDSTRTRFLADSLPVGLLGFDAEVKVIKTDAVDLKPYVDYSMLLGGDGGLTVGALGRFNFGTSVVHAFRAVAEFRYLGDRYIPSYFDTFYEVERFVAAELPREDPSVANYITKRQLAFAGLGRRAGYYFEASWGIRGAIGFTLALEGVSNSAQKNFVAHLEVPFFNWLQIFGSYYKRGFSNFAEFGQLERSVVFAGARLRVLPFLFVNGRVYKTFRVTDHLERYDNQFGFAVDAEVGWEFAWKKEEPKPTPPPDDGRSATPATEAAPAPAPEPAPGPAPAPPAEEPAPVHDSPY